MKKISTLVLAFALALSMAACSDSKTISSKNSGATTTTAASQAASDAGSADATSAKVDVTIDTTGNFVFAADNEAKTSITMGTTEIDALLKALGEPQSKLDVPSCAHATGKDSIYTFTNYVLTVYDPEDGNKPYVSDILLSSDLIKTPEGLEIGMSKDDVVAKYGDADEADDKVMTYKRGTSVLRITMKTDKIASIEYMIP